MRSISGMCCGMLRFVQREDGISFIECALVAALAAVLAGMAFLALSKRT